jgi:hypothetical protein
MQGEKKSMALIQFFYKGAKEALRVGKMNVSKRVTLIRIRIHKTASSS